MKFLRQVDLSSNNTLALPCVADQIYALYDHDDVLAVSAQLGVDKTKLILGGGSNLVLPPHLSMPVLQYRASDIKFSTQANGGVLVEADAGVSWDELVDVTVEKSLRGIENLSLIPGTVGAAPVQNIGAYGVELSNVLTYVEAFCFETATFKRFTKEDCLFAYRDSLFKRNPGLYLITRIGLTLSADAPFTLEYGELKQLQSIKELSVRHVRDEVIRIRQAKLPDPRVIANAGSFFKNPVISVEQLNGLLKSYPDMVHYPVAETEFKVAAGWLIDRAGWKGYQNGRVGVNDKQALVLINLSGTQDDVLALATRIQNDIWGKFGIGIEIEPVVVEG